MTLFEQYLKEQKVNGLKESTLINLKSFFKMANEYKPLERWNKEDIDSFILNLQKDYKKGTVELQKRRL